MNKLLHAVCLAALPLWGAVTPAQERYLAFQIFTRSEDSGPQGRNFPPLDGKLVDQVDGLARAIGATSVPSRQLGFVVGPLAFDDPDERIRQLMRTSFSIALEKNIAVGFHVDDSMFWGRQTDLNKPENVEWVDWNKTPNTGRRLDWSSTPTKIAPQLCFNSSAVRDAVRKRARLIGEEVVRGTKLLQARHRPELFIGVIAGWETQIGRDFDTGKPSGYHALANLGYGPKKPPADVDQARVRVVADYIDFWTKCLAEAGVPDERIYSHTACQASASYDMGRFGQPGQFPLNYLETVNFTPPSAAFGSHHRPGFSTYPQFGILEQIDAERGAHGNPAWASCEGTAADPGAIEHGGAGFVMERYLGNLFNRGAVLVNVFGWGVGPPSNPFRTIVENPASIAAYRKWLGGGTLPSDPPAELPSPTFFDKIRRLQKELPPYMAKHGGEKIGPQYEALSQALRAQRFHEAEVAVDAIFRTMRMFP